MRIPDLRKSLLLSFRILFRYRLYTTINLVGMGMAIAVCLLISNYVINSYNYDTFNKNSDRIYRLSMKVHAGGNTDHYATTGRPLGKTLSDNYGTISSYAQLTPFRSASVRLPDEMFMEEGFYAANPEILDVFTFEFVKGNKNTCFLDPNTVLLTRSLAEKYFGSTEILNETIQIGKQEYTVSGIIEDWPGNSHIAIKALLRTSKQDLAFELQDWFNLDHYTYVLLDQHSNPEALDSALNQLKENHLTTSLEGSGIEVSFHAQSLKGLYFETGLIDDLPKGNRTYVNALGFAGILILIISGLNYINLTLTQSTHRTKEIAMKRVLGIGRKQLLLQYGIESLVMAALFLLIAVIIISNLANPYEKFTGFDLRSLLTNWSVLLSIVLISVVLGFVGNIYSGAYLSFFSVLESSGKTMPVSVFKKTLLGFQFAISAMIIMATLLMNDQINFVKNKDLGFKKEEIAIITLPDGPELRNEFIAFKEKLTGFANIENASLIGGGALPGEENGKDIFQVEHEGERIEKIYNIYRIDENYFDLLDVQFIGGRDFSKERPADKKTGVIINENLAKSLGWANALGKKIWHGEESMRVIGVITDFHNKSLHNPIEPIVFLYDENWSSKLLVKVSASNADLLKAEWENVFPDNPFLLTFFDDYLKAQYNKEDRVARLFSMFSVIALALSAMGLFAIFSLNVLQKSKEISIRKVSGANSVDIISNITKNYFLIALIAIVVSIPVAWIFISNWLESFAYKVNIDPVTFIFSAAILLLACFLAMLYHVFKASGINPAHTLRQE